MVKSKQEFDQIFINLEAQRLERQTQRNERNKWAANAVASRIARETGEMPPLDLTTLANLTTVFQSARTAELEAEMLAEQARMAAISPHALWLSTLPYGERERVVKWEAVNGRQWPLMPDKIQ